MTWKRKAIHDKEDTWESRENLRNAIELVEEFESKYRREEEEEVRQQEAEENKKVFSRELPGKYMAKLLYHKWLLTEFVIEEFWILKQGRISNKRCC